MSITPIPPIGSEPFEPDIPAGTVENEDGDLVVDPDADEDIVDSADADRLAAEDQ